MATDHAPVDLDALASLERAATPGPWNTDPETRAGRVWVSANAPVLEPTYSWRRMFEARSDMADWRPTLGVKPRNERFWQTKEANADLIAAARNALPALIAELREARARLAAAEKIVEAAWAMEETAEEALGERTRMYVSIKSAHQLGVALAEWDRAKETTK